MKLHNVFKENKISSRISPTPRSTQAKVGCGVSIIIKPEDLNSIKDLLKRSDLKYADIVKIEDQINPKRDKYC